MNDKPSTAGPAPPWCFVTLVAGFAAYYAHDVWGGRFETVAYGFLCISILAALGLLLVVPAITRRPESPAEDQDTHAIGVPKSVRPFLLLFILIAYAAMQATAGFALATFIACACLIRLFGERRWRHLFVSAGGLTILSHVIFVQLLSLPVPEGALLGWR